MTPEADSRFAGSIPQLYERLLVPMIFEPYAADLAARVAQQAPLRVLEVAAGTGVVTRHLARLLPAAAAITATDLNPPMLALAQAIGTARAVRWKSADAQQLPFADASFDAVVCQFGAMFFPDKVRAYAEARRVLREGGTLLFNVWDSIEHNEFAHCVTQALTAVFADDPPLFVQRVPHGYYDMTRVTDELSQAGFTHAPRIDKLPARSRADSASMAATAYCQGTPLRNEIEARSAARLDEATRASEAAIAQRFGSGAVDGKIQAWVVVVER